ncbi:MAG: hypothetical protein RR353_04610 [Victivallaceae bacterium]
MPLDMTNHGIINVSDGIDSADGVNNKQVSELTISVITGGAGNTVKFILLTGTEPSKPVTGDLVFNGTSSVINTGNASNPTDALPFGQLKSEINKTEASYLKLSGGIMTGDIDMNSHNVSDIVSNANEDALSFGELKSLLTNALNASYIPLTGNSKINPITGNLIFDGTHILKSLATPIQPDDAVNLRFLKSEITKTLKGFLPLLGGTMIGSLNLGSKQITNIKTATPTETTHAVPLSQVISQTQNVLANYLPKTGGIVSNFNLNNHKIVNIVNIDAPINDRDLVNLNTMNTKVSKYLTKTGGSLSGALSFNNSFTVTNSANPTDEGDIINKSYIDTLLNNFVPLAGTVTGNPVTGNVTLSPGATVTGIPDAVLDSDIVNFKFMQSETASSLSGLLNASGTPDMKVSLNLGIGTRNNNIKNLSQTLLTGNDLINKNTMNTEILSFFNNYVLLKGSDNYVLLKGSDLTGALTVQGKIINLKDYSDKGEAVNLQSMNRWLDLFAKKASTNTIDNINMRNSKITALGNAVLDSDIVNKSILDGKTALLVSLAGSTMTGNIVLNTTKITGITTTTTTDDSDIVSQDALDTVINQKKALLLPLGTPKPNMTGPINMSGHRVMNVKNGIADTDAVNSSQADNLIQNGFSNHLLKTGGIITAPINAANYAIIQNNYSAAPSVDSAAVTRTYATASLEPYVKKNVSNTMTGNLNMNNNKITNLSNPTDDSDAVNLRQLNTRETNTKHTLLPITGGTVNGSINLSGAGQIIGLPLYNTSTPPVQTAVSYSSLTSLTDLTFDNKYIRLNGGQVNQNIDMGNTFKVINLADPITNQDAVNKRSLDKKILLYVKTSTTNTMTGSLDMGNKKITSVANPVNSSDLTNLTTVTTNISTTFASYLLLDGTRQMTESINLGSNSVKNIKNPSTMTSLSAVSLGYVKTNIPPLLNLAGGTMTGSMNMSSLGQVEITTTPSSSTNPVPMKSLVPYQIPYKMRTSNNYLIDGTAPTDIITNTPINFELVQGTYFDSFDAASFFRIEDITSPTLYQKAALRILQKGTYMFILNLETEVPRNNGTATKTCSIILSLNGTETTVTSIYSGLSEYSLALFTIPITTGTDNHYIKLYNNWNTRPVYGLSWSICQITP